MLKNSCNEIVVLVAGGFGVSPDNISRLRHTVPELDAIEVAADRDQLCARAAAAGCAVGIVDAESPGLPQLVERFHQEAAGGILAVMEDAAEGQIVELLSAGVMGVVFACSPAEELITAIRAIAAGHMFVPPPFLPALADTMLHNPLGDRARELRRILTGRELDVLLLLASGSANREIADELGISVTTVRSHVLSILRKMNVPNRTVAAIHAFRSGLTRTNVDGGGCGYTGF